MVRAASPALFLIVLLVAIAATAADPAPAVLQPAERPSDILDLAPSRYVVQLIALSSREDLDAFIERHAIDGVKVRTRVKGEVRFVLLQGIYEDRESAMRAASRVPESLATKPWIRSLGSLQDAVRSARGLPPAAQPHGAPTRTPAHDLATHANASAARRDDTQRK